MTDLELGPVTLQRKAEERVRELEQELAAATYMLGECRRIARDAIERCERLSRELAEQRGELSALEQANEELEDELEQMAKREMEESR